MFNFIRKHLSYRTTKISIGTVKLNAILADSFLKRAIGLMYRDSIGINECMLFTFPREENLGIWMKSMKFAIDIIWLDSNMNIVTIKKSVPPCKGILCKTYYPQKNSMYVIELKAGFVTKNSINKQTRIKISEGRR